MSETEFKSYLLGLLPESEQTQFELRLLSDNTAYEQLLVAEDELIEAFLQKELTAEETARFERVFLAHPTRRRHLALVQTLQTGADNQPPNRAVAAGTTPKHGPRNYFLDMLRNPLWQLAAVGLVLGIVLGARYCLLDRPKAQDQVAVGATSAPQVSPTPAASVGTAVLSAELSSGQVMAIGNEKKILHITPTIGQVKLELWLQKDQFESYKVALQTYDPVSLKELTGEFKRQGTKDLKFIEVLIPVTDLQGQDFMLKVDGITPSGERQKADSFQFKVKRE